ncbi:MAG TPA: heavy metal translocating P-type ATPase [Acidimicrobiia bacterium]|nr:heavy metal translocating P-type ATPase [Acidimicrobiia bacterium]
MNRVRLFLQSRQGMVALGSLVAIAASLILGLAGASETVTIVPLIVIVVIGGVPLVWEITKDLIARTPGADLLAAIAIVTAVLLDEWMVAAIIVLMLSGGEALEEAATARASRVLEALAKRAPTLAHRLIDGKTSERTEDVPVSEIAIGDRIVVLPHEVCPVDGEVVHGHGSMDESYLTGEPYVITKSVGSRVLSGAINGEDRLIVEATKTAADSRFAQIVGVLAEAEQNRPRMRRMADRLGAWYTVLALAMGVLGWLVSDDPERFLSVMVIATPCPLLIAVPVAIVGAISLAARSAIIVRDPGILERIPQTTTMMFDKTGTLTYGRPAVTDVVGAEGVDTDEVLRLAGALERYSRHPLAGAVVDAAEAALGDRAIAPVESLSERPGEGLVGEVDGHKVRITSRERALERLGDGAVIPPGEVGMEAVVLIDGAYAATLRFRDEPRMGSWEFVQHLGPRHGVTRTMLISGDRSTEVEYLAERVGITEVHSGASPEKKLELVRAVEDGITLFLGDGINDAPAMAAADVGIAFGNESDVTSEAAGAVVLDSSLERLDELLHIGERMRRIALQSALGGIGLSIIGMVFAVMGMLPPLVGAIAQEAIDLLAILNAARVVARRKPMADYHDYPLPEPAPKAVQAA